MSENEFNNPDRTEGNPAQNEEDMDFIYGEDADYDYDGSLDNISAESITLDSMDSGVKLEEMRSPKHKTSSNLKLQMMADDIAMNMDEQPVLKEMSTEYGNSKKREEDILKKDKLDRDEKELIKNRLKAEIYSKPEGYNQKKSMEMYNKLMREQRAKEAKHGLIVVLILVVVGLASAALTYFTKMENYESASEYLVYLPFATAFFSLLMLVRKKAFRIFTLVYFIGNSIVLLGPGLIVFALTPENQSVGGEFIQKICIYVAAILLSSFVSFRLAASEAVRSYYSYKG